MHPSSWYELIETMAYLSHAELLTLALTCVCTNDYVAVYLRDLTFIQEGNQLHQTAGVINYERLRLFAKTVRSTFVGSHAASSYVLEHDPVLFRLCLDVRTRCHTGAIGSLADLDGGCACSCLRFATRTNSTSARSSYALSKHNNQPPRPPFRRSPSRTRSPTAYSNYSCVFERSRKRVVP